MSSVVLCGHQFHYDMNEIKRLDMYKLMSTTFNTHYRKSNIVVYAEVHVNQRQNLTFKDQSSVYNAMNAAFEE